MQMLRSAYTIIPIDENDLKAVIYVLQGEQKSIVQSRGYMLYASDSRITRGQKKGFGIDSCQGKVSSLKHLTAWYILKDMTRVVK